MPDVMVPTLFAVPDNVAFPEADNEVNAPVEVVVAPIAIPFSPVDVTVPTLVPPTVKPIPVL
jgi:hypothetical protein